MGHEAAGEAQKLCMADIGSSEAPRLSVCSRYHRHAAATTAPYHCPQVRAPRCPTEDPTELRLHFEFPQTQVLPEKRECSPHAESGTSRSPERGRQGKNPLSSPVIHRVWRLLSSVAQQFRQTPEIPCLMLSGFGTSAGPLIPTLEPSFQGSRDSHAQQCQSSSHLPEHCCFSTFQWLMEWLSTTRGAGRWGGRGEDTRSS